MLRPFSHISDLAVWDYFTREELRAGPAYDLEIAGAEAGAGLGAETAETADGSMISECGLVTRPSLTLGYDNLSTDHPDMVRGYKLVPQIDPSVPQPVVQLRRRPLLGAVGLTPV